MSFNNRMGFDSMASWNRSALDLSIRVKSNGLSDSAVSLDNPTASTRSLTIPNTLSFQAVTSRWSPPTSPTTSEPQSRHTSPTTSLVPSLTKCSFGSSKTPALTHRERNRLASQLYAASCAGDISHIELLLYLGAPVNAGTLVQGLYTAFKPAKHGHLSPLAGAAMHGHLEAARILLTHGAHLNPDVSQSSSAPLHQASRADDLKMAAFLLSAGSHVDAQNAYKTTPVMYASRHASPEMVRLLLSYKPDLRIKSMVGTNAIHWAMLPHRKESKTIIRLLLDAGADPNQRMATDGTALHYAAQSGLAEVATLFLAFGADRGARNQDWQTPAEVAASVGSDACVEALRWQGIRRAR